MSNTSKIDEMTREPGIATSMPSRSATLRDYISIARPDHWFKNIFMIPGILFAITFGAEITNELIWKLPIGVLSVCLIASANYTINEWLDREFDKHHPKKSKRPSVVSNIKQPLVYTQWAVLAIVGLWLSWLIRTEFFWVNSVLLLMGILYNVRPFRTKDRAYLDVLSESINNPLRFLLGWYLLEPTIVAPSSVLIAYWLGGAYLMGMKRYAEFRMIGDKTTAALYRRSFANYDEISLLVSSFIYALISSALLGIFMVKYKAEFILVIPLVAVLFGWYLFLGAKEDSVVQTPERLYEERGLWYFMVFIFAVAVFSFYIEIPYLARFLEIKAL